MVYKDFLNMGMLPLDLKTWDILGFVYFILFQPPASYGNYDPTTRSRCDPRELN